MGLLPKCNFLFRAGDYVTLPPRSLLADIRYGCERRAELRQRTLEEVPAQDAGRALVIKDPAYDPLHSIAPAPAPSMGNAGS